MSGVVPGTLVQMRTLRRFHHYNAGEVIAVPLEAARDLDAKRLAQPLHPGADAGRRRGAGRACAAPAPGGMVRK